MSFYESTSNWPSEARKIVLRNIPDVYNTVAMRETKDGTNVFRHIIASSCQIVISYYYPKKVFIIWNGAVHHHIHNVKGMTSLSVGVKGEALINAGFGDTQIGRVFKPIVQKDKKDCGEIVLIVGKNALYDFCKSYEDYLFPIHTMIPKGKKCLYSKPGEPLYELNGEQSMSFLLGKREREIVTRAQRDRRFREIVIKKWDGKCIVCGATERAILEAAHIESVANGGSDNPENGYCLCANHHRMYDQGIIDIDVVRNIFQCHSKNAKNMPWYYEAAKRNYQLYLPTD